MFSSIASFLPSLHLPSSSSNSNVTAQSQDNGYNPTDDAEEIEAYKQQPAEDEANARKSKAKGANETFIIVRPPPAKSNHPLNLQVQLVPPASRSTRQSLDDSDGGDSANNTVSLTRTASNRSDTSSYGSTASFSSTASVSSTRRTIIPLYNLHAHNVMTNTIVDAGTDAKIAKFQKRGIELIDLAILEPVEVWSERARPTGAIRNSRPATPDPSAHTTTTAESSVVSLPHTSSNLNPNSAPNTTPNLSTQTTPTGQPAPGSTSSKRNLFGKMFKKKDSSSVISPPVSPAPHYSPTSSPLQLMKSLTPDTAATPTQRFSRSHTRNLSAVIPSSVSGKLRGRSSSPNPRVLGLGLLQVPSLEDPHYNQSNGSSTDLSHTPTTAAPLQSANGNGEDQKIMRPPVLGIQPTLSYSYSPGMGSGVAPEPLPLSSLTKAARALMYVWFVRRWFKRRADDADPSGLLGLVQAHTHRPSGGRGSGFSINGKVEGPVAGDGVEVRFEWKRNSTKGKVKKGREKEKEGKQQRRKTGTEEGPDKGKAGLRERASEASKLSNRLSIVSHHSITTSISVSEDGHGRSGTPTRDRERERRGSFGGSRYEDDGEDSDPEDSETPWVCTLKIRRTNAGTTGSTFTTRSRQATSHGMGVSEGGGDEEVGVLPQGQSPQVLRMKVGTLSPTPHHPKLVAMLKVPFPLPDIEVERMGVVKRPAAYTSTRPTGTQWSGLTLTAEEIKDVVCSTAMWLVVREGFGGIGKVSRKGDGWRIRA